MESEGEQLKRELLSHEVSVTFHAAIHLLNQITLPPLCDASPGEGNTEIDPVPLCAP